MTMRKRLRKWNDLSHAAAWLTEQSGECWEALDLANAGSHNKLRLYVHFRLPPEYVLEHDQPRALREGCMTEIVFNQDLDRMTQANEVLLKIFRYREGDEEKHILVEPGLIHTLDEIRVREADLLAFLDSIKPHRGTGKVEARKAKISAILSMIEEADSTFSRHAMPGRKVDFFALCQRLDRASFAHIVEATFCDYLKGLCSFKPGARKDDYYQRIAAQLGVKSVDTA